MTGRGRFGLTHDDDPTARREPETGHAWLFATMALVASHAAVQGWWPAAAWTMAFNVALNAYPIVLQRYNRRWLLDRIALDQEPGV
ncbi:MAG: hypothetical protein U5K29_15995 [Acidimicrobiales bacterium]|nr:hypothetical protein [Acidimicrobiales bacterium]